MNWRGIEKRRSKGEKIIKIWKSCGCHYDLSKKNVGIKGTTPKACSCWMCGNYRKLRKGSDRLTIAERSWLQRRLEE